MEGGDREGVGVGGWGGGLEAVKADTTAICSICSGMHAAEKMRCILLLLVSFT